MFDHTFQFGSTDNMVQLIVRAGTEGVKSITVLSGQISKSITAQKLMDIIEPALQAWAAQ